MRSASPAYFPIPGTCFAPEDSGEFALSVKTKPGALLVPQRAVTELQGSYQVAVVGEGNKVNIRPVTVGERIGNMWIVRRSEARRDGGCGGAEKGQGWRAGQSQAIRCAAESSESGRVGMSKFFINRPIVAMVIAILMVIVGAVTIAGLPVAQFPADRAAGSSDSRHLRRRGRADHRAVGGHAHRAADERRGQHELHVFAQLPPATGRCG